MVDRSIGRKLGLRLDQSRLDALDVDYLDKLSESQLAWFKRFVCEYYSGQSPSLHDRESMRAIWRADKARKRDIYARCSRLSMDPENPKHQAASPRPAPTQKIPR